MGTCVGERKDVVQEQGRCRHEDASVMEYEPLVDGPGGPVRTGGHGVAACAQRGVSVQLLSEVIEELERWSRERCEGRRISVAETHQERGVAITAGQRIGHHVRLAWAVLNPEIIPEQFAHPVKL